MANRRQRRLAKKDRRRIRPPQPEPPPQQSSVVLYARPADRVERLTYTRRQAAEALGVSLSTIDRRVVPTLNTFFNEWGMRLIPVDELKRYIAEHTRAARAELRPRRPQGRKPKVPADVVARIRAEHTQGVSLALIARGLDRDGIQTAQGGRRWWPSTVRDLLVRNSAEAR